MPTKISISLFRYFAPKFFLEKVGNRPQRLLERSLRQRARAAASEGAGFVHVGGQALSRGAERGLPPLASREAATEGAPHARRTQPHTGRQAPARLAQRRAREAEPAPAGEARGARSRPGRADAAAPRIARTRGKGHARRRLPHQTRGAAPSVRSEGRRHGRRREPTRASAVPHPRAARADRLRG